MGMVQLAAGPGAMLLLRAPGRASAKSGQIPGRWSNILWVKTASAGCNHRVLVLDVGAGQRVNPQVSLQGDVGTRGACDRERCSEVTLQLWHGSRKLLSRTRSFCKQRGGCNLPVEFTSVTILTCCHLKG